MKESNAPAYICPSSALFRDLWETYDRPTDRRIPTSLPHPPERLRQKLLLEACCCLDTQLVKIEDCFVGHGRLGGPACAVSSPLTSPPCCRQETAQVPWPMQQRAQHHRSVATLRGDKKNVLTSLPGACSLIPFYWSSLQHTGRDTRKGCSSQGVGSPRLASTPLPGPAILLLLLLPLFLRRLVACSSPLPSVPRHT